MKKLIFLTLPLCAVLLFAGRGNAQQHPAETIIRGSGKAAVIVVGTAGKITYKTAKFTAKHVVMPTAKIVFKPVATRVAPAAARFTLKFAGKVAKQTVRAGGKLGFAYLKTKLP